MEMHKPNLLIVLLATFVLNVNMQKLTKSNNCSNKQFDKDFGHLLMLDGRSLPETKEDLRKYCRTNLETIPKLLDHQKKCFKGTIKSIVGLLLYSIKLESKRFCTKPRSQRSLGFISMSRCLNRNKPKWRHCFDIITKNFAFIKYVPNSVKMPYTCCEYVKSINCFRLILEQEKCEHHMPSLVDMMQSYSGNFVDAMCGDYNTDSDKCDRLPPLKARQLKNNGTFLRNLVAIFDSIE